MPKSSLYENGPHWNIGVGRGGPGKPGGGGGGRPPNNYLCETGKNHNCTKLKGKIIINVTLI